MNMSKSRRFIPGDSRRSTAAQFFLDEEIVEQKSTSDRVADLLNQAVVPAKDCQKVQNLRQVQELIIHKEPNLLDNFLDEMVAFQHDRNAEVRKFIVSFIEEACKKDPEVLPKVVANLNMMLTDESTAVQKRVIQAASQLYKVALRWLCTAKSIDDIMESTWAYITQLKTRILSLLESENDGRETLPLLPPPSPVSAHCRLLSVRTHTIKFMEMIVITQTYPDADSPKKAENEIALDDIPVILKIFRPRKMEEEAKHIFEMLISFHGTPHISSVNLMACMQSLALIAKQRGEFMPKVLQALEALHANLPPTLAKSQVSSVRKHLKLQLMNLVKHRAAVEYHTQISTLLTDLGATPQEIIRCIPKIEELRKRQRAVEEGNKAAKKLKLEEDDEADDEKGEDESEPKPALKISKAATNTAIDITAEDLVPKLNYVNVSDLVLVSMLALPESMPAQFQASYTPIAVAGTTTQIKHLARLLATQLTAVGLGKGVEEMKKVKEALDESGFDEDEGESAPIGLIQTLVGRTVDHEKKKKKTPLLLMPTGSQGKNTRKLKQLNLLEITKPLTDEQANKMSDAALLRILYAEKSATLGGVSVMRNKILASLATQFRGSISTILKSYIFEDLRNRADIAFAWLYEEYAGFQGFSQVSHLQLENSIGEYYEECMAGLLEGLLQESDQKDRDIFFLDSPCITDRLADYLKRFCEDESTVNHGMYTAKTMVERRPPKQLLFLGVVSELTLHERIEVRNQAVKTAKQLHERGHLRPYIEAFALRSLKFLLGPVPPSDLILDNPQIALSVWTEDATKICLHLYLALLPINHRLIHDLASVYVGTVADIKRTILRALEVPVKGMGMSSPELLLLVENCPKGAETLVTRIIHILTDKAPPSSELVARVRDLYHKRVPDVRFLIPVLNGLSKKEVIAALPKLIKLNPIVVKEVFNRLLGSHAEAGTNFTSPLTPAELLISLHNIDPTKCDMKTIIKATSLCFAEKHVYTQEVLAVVMQQLMEQNPLPTLLMRTVIQSLSLYPRLIGFVMNILQRLILKQVLHFGNLGKVPKSWYTKAKIHQCPQNGTSKILREWRVWKQKKVWEGFIKCCQRTKPQSFQVLLQLPPAQLENVFDVSPDLREPLFQHVESFTEHQKAHIPQAIMDILSIGQKPVEEKPVTPIPDPIEEPEDEPEPPPPGHEFSPVD